MTAEHIDSVERGCATGYQTNVTEDANLIHVYTCSSGNNCNDDTTIQDVCPVADHANITRPSVIALLAYVIAHAMLA